ncbi:MAG TPA: hypothetical protein VLJ59_01045 [Mycobacteriales bacterium]|nr:hypothetical protein [Mycobacteriales bacterium]
MPTETPRTLPAGLDAVEIKVTLAADLVDDAVAAFDLRPGAAERRRIWFCEQITGYGGPTRLPLLARGLILRVRSTAGGAGDSTVKLRGPEGCVDPRAWHRRTRKLEEKARIEGDWVGQRHLVSASLDDDVENDLIEKVAARRSHRVARLFAGQEKLTRDWLVPLDQLEMLGPIAALKWAPDARDPGPGVAAELWEVDGSLRFLELSVRVEENPAVAQRKLEESVRSRGFDLAAVQETKTRIVLEHLAAAAGQR